MLEDITFFEHASKVKRLTFDSEEFCKYLAYHDYELVQDVKKICHYFEDFLNPEDIKKSLRFSMGVEGFKGKMLLKSGNTFIKLYARIDELGNPMIRIGINDSIREFTNKEEFLTALNVFEEKVRTTGKIAKTVTAADFQTAFNDFLKYCKGLLSTHYSKMDKKEYKWHFVLEPMIGGKYIRLVKGDIILDDGVPPPKSLSNFTSRSAWAFIDKSNGDVFKPASWAAPAAKARANIYDKGTWNNVTSAGPNYLK